MEEKRDRNVEKLAEELESRIARKEEAEDSEDLLFEDIQEGWYSEEEAQEDRFGEENPDSEYQENRAGKGSQRNRPVTDSAGKRIQGNGPVKENSGKDPQGNRFERRSPGTESFRDRREGKKQEEESPEDDWEEEDVAPMKPWMMAAIMVGLIVLAAVICAVLWHFTHLENGEEEDRTSVSASADHSESNLAGTEEPAEATPELSPTPDQAIAFGQESLSTSVEASSGAATATMPGQTTAQSGAQNTVSVQEPVSGTTAMEFTQDNADVTPKDVINLRSEPSTLNADNIVAQAKNGEILSRTGVNGDTGWTRIDYNGETLYAVSQYLTTDLTYKPPVQAADPNRVNTMDGRIILFTDCSDNITPKEYVNLRTEPSTSEGESTVRCQISNGEVVHRTGYSPDAGWSRVEYNGEILYVVSSYMYTVE